MKRALHFPLDFDRQEQVRLFTRKLCAGGHVATREAALLLAVLAWFEWAVGGVAWRPLRGKVGDWRSHDWAREDLTYAIESYGNFSGPCGSMILAGLESGFFEITDHGEISGLELAGFAEHNPHLDPEYRTIQQRGGDARAARRAEERAARAAGERREILQSQGALDFESETPDADEQKRVIGLIMRLDRACGRALRANGDYHAELLRAALRVARSHTREEIYAVENYLVENRENPQVVKVTERVLAAFSEVVRQALTNSES